MHSVLSKEVKKRLAWKGRRFCWWPGRGPYSHLPPWQRPGWAYGPGSCRWILSGESISPDIPISSEDTLEELEAYKGDMENELEEIKKGIEGLRKRIWSQTIEMKQLLKNKEEKKIKYRVEINRETCIACGICYDTDTTHFEEDAEGKAKVVNGTNNSVSIGNFNDEIIEGVQKIAENCPVNAISVSEE